MAISARKITKTDVDGLEPNSMLWDPTLTGFGVRRQTRSRVYIVRYQWRGQQRIDTLGKHGPLTVDRARTEALRRLGLAATGVDPRGPDTVALTFTDCAERYLAALTAKRLSTVKQYERYLRVIASPMHRLVFGEIERRAIAELLRDIEKRRGGPTRNRLRSALSGMWTWAIREGLVETNPVSGTGKAIERSRERVLSRDELAKLWHGLDDSQFSRIVRLLILTGQRRTEVGGMRWRELAGDTWTIPGARTKNHQEHKVPLTPLALSLLPERRGDRPYLWGTAVGFTGWSKAKAALDRRIGFADWRLHDIRRTVATGLGELGYAPPHVVETLLNHVSGFRAGVSGTYNRARYADEVRAALDKWSSYVQAL
jgi:integrase